MQHYDGIPQQTARPAMCPRAKRGCLLCWAFRFQKVKARSVTCQGCLTVISRPGSPLVTQHLDTAPLATGASSLLPGSLSQDVSCPLTTWHDGGDHSRQDTPDRRAGAGARHLCGLPCLGARGLQPAVGGQLPFWRTCGDSDAIAHGLWVAKVGMNLALHGSMTSVPHACTQVVWTSVWPQRAIASSIAWVI